MYIINANFTIVKPIGDLSPSKIGLLKEAFKEFPEFITPQPQVVIFKRGVTHLIFSPTQIAFAMQGDSTEFNFENISELILKANEVLGLSSSSMIVINYEGTENTNDNVLEKSKQINSEVTSLLNAYGVGLRFMIDQSNFKGDLRIEPFIRDNQKFFVQVILESQRPIEADEMKDYFMSVFNFGVESGVNAAKKVFSL